jgi:flavin reductase (DIM6/NTAB) family NADH-FMN oxidoreductase RutF
MSARIAVPLPKAYLLLNHGPTVLVSSAHGGGRNVMAAAWNMALDFDPPKVAVVIDKSTLTRELVEASGEFVLNVPARGQAALTLAVGSASGRDGDKISKVMRSGIHSDGAASLCEPGQALRAQAAAASRIKAPLIEGCLAWLECRVIPEPHIQQTYDLFLGEVLAAWADPAAFSDNRWHFPSDDRRSIHYISGGSFFATGDEFKA